MVGSWWKGGAWWKGGMKLGTVSELVHKLIKSFEVNDVVWDGDVVWVGDMVWVGDIVLVN